MSRRCVSILGLALAVLGIVALAGPGRIDIDDGQARYEAGRCLVEHGDPGIRDPRIVWHRFPGRNDTDFTYYRMTGEAVAGLFAALGHALSDDEGTRHFVFSLNGAATAAVLAIVYAGWFRRRGVAPGRSLLYAAAGVLCTPCFYYATSTFDDLLGTLMVVLAITQADRAQSGSTVAVLLTAVAVALCLNSKQPLAAFLLPALVFADNPAWPTRRRLVTACVIVAGLIGGFVVYYGIENWKFPPAQKARHEAIWNDLGITVFNGNPTEALIDFAVGPSSGAIWYCPTLLLCLAGLRWRWNDERRRVAALLVACGVVTLFYSTLTFYKGGVCWGPRYLTPLFGALWLYAPHGSALLKPRLTRLLLIAGLFVQILGLSLIPERLYVWRELPTGFYMAYPWWYLHPALGHIINRPAEIVDALAAPPAPEFTPGPTPTHTLPVFDPPYYTGPKGVAGVRRYTLLNTFRPWWATFPHLPPDQRPVNVPAAALGFGTVAILGLLLMRRSIRNGAPPWGQPST